MPDRPERRLGREHPSSTINSDSYRSQDIERFFPRGVCGISKTNDTFCVLCFFVWFSILISKIIFQSKIHCAWIIVFLASVPIGLGWIKYQTIDVRSGVGPNFAFQTLTSGNPDWFIVWKIMNGCKCDSEVRFKYVNYAYVYKHKHRKSQNSNEIESQLFRVSRANEKNFPIVIDPNFLSLCILWGLWNS